VSEDRKAGACGRTALASLLCLILSWPTIASAWGPQGHLLIGTLAEGLLSPAARDEVNMLLGYDLGMAAKWADCVRNVVHNEDGTFKYFFDPHYAAACKGFGRADRMAMEDYAGRNWTLCEGHDVDDATDEANQSGCASSYHYADIAIERDGYGPTYGTNDHDIVHTIEAAIAVLEDREGPTALSIAGKREALLLLAHLVGDLHQPLHVGAIYLDTNGEQVDPDLVGADAAANAGTRGGNWIAFGPNGKQNLHAVWDAIPPGWDVTKLNDRKREGWDLAASAVLSTPGEPAQWPTAWATESVLVSRRAFEGLEFRFDPATKHWTAAPTNSKQYAKDRRDTQRLQIARAAARLAALLNAIWPDPR
jgi:hypothetical protein